MPWTKCLPLALLRIRTCLKRVILPYEMMFGLPHLENPQYETKDMSVKNCIFVLSSFLSYLRNKGLLTQTIPLEFAVHKFQPGDWVLIKSDMRKIIAKPGTGPTKSY
uniref:Uncharacterized protein n=1 Tax=Micrurus paraensis TaxID=1970185 RepID=A0A2D4L7B5_9SAUR